MKIRKLVTTSLIFLSLLLVYPKNCATIIDVHIPRVEEKKMVRLAPTGDYTEYTMLVTAYSLSYECCGKYPDHPAYGITASGKEIGVDIFEEEGIIAAPINFEFGTEMLIEGYGMSTVWDRGSAIKWWPHLNMYGIDIFFNDDQSAIDWGIKFLKVKVFE